MAPRKSSGATLENHGRADEELRRIPIFFHDATDPIFIIDASGLILGLNAEAVREYEWSRGGLVGKSFKMIVPVGEHEQRERHFRMLSRWMLPCRS